MLNVFLNKTAKNDLKENNLDEKFIIDNVKEAFEEDLKEEQPEEEHDVLLVLQTDNATLLIVGIRNKTTITISDIVANTIIV